MSLFPAIINVTIQQETACETFDIDIPKFEKENSMRKHCYNKQVAVRRAISKSITIK
jgi:hypothetical protein